MMAAKKVPLVTAASTKPNDPGLLSSTNRGRRELTLANCLLASINMCAMPQLPETPKVNTCDTTVGEKSTG